MLNRPADGDESNARLCPKCGYDRRDLPLDRACPECGHRDGPKKAAGMADCTTWDTAEVEALRGALSLAFLAWLVLFGAMSLFVTFPINSVEPIVMSTLALLGAAIQAAAHWRLFTARRDANLRTHGWKTAAGAASALAVALVVYIGVGMVAYFIGPATGVPLVTIGLLLWFASRIASFVHLERLADATGDESLGRRFWGLAFALGFFGPLGALFAYQTVTWNLWICLGVLCFPFGYLVVEGMIAWSLLGLRSNFAWAVRYHYQDAGKSERLRARMESDRRHSRGGGGATGR
ncbi:MAG: hypothetical protein ACF8PN_04605 [Phycisphaerales bacterium]